MGEQDFWTDEAQQKLSAWFHWLDDNRGDRARLRRAESADDVLLSEPFFNFLRQMPDSWALVHNLPVAAMIAAVLTHVKDGLAKRDPGQKSFAGQLAVLKSGSDKARMSELRFQQLQKSRTPDEFFRRLIRAVKLVDGQVNTLSLADSIRRWMNEYRYGISLKPLDRLAVCWANDYYSELIKNQK